MRFTDRKTLFTDRIPLLSIRSIRTDRHMAYTDRYGAGVLDNPHGIVFYTKLITLDLMYFVRIVVLCSDKEMNISQTLLIKRHFMKVISHFSHVLRIG